MVIEAKVRKETQEFLIEKFGPECNALLDYLFLCNVLDVNKCRIALIKKYYRDHLCSNPAYEAKRLTAETFCISEKMVEDLIYKEFYKKIALYFIRGLFFLRFSI